MWNNVFSKLRNADNQRDSHLQCRKLSEHGVLHQFSDSKRKEQATIIAKTMSLPMVSHSVGNDKTKVSRGFYITTILLSRHINYPFYYILKHFE